MNLLATFITLEGGDGTGKSTQFNLLVEHLQDQGLDFVHAREPGGTHVSEQVRQVLLDPANQMGVITEALLYSAARAELVSRVIRPALDRGQLVLLDRYVDSSLVYQAYAGGLPAQWVQQINEMATGGLRPHRTILLDLPVEEAMRRKASQTGASGLDRMEGRQVAYHKLVREGYLELVNQEPRRMKVVDASGSVDEVQQRIRKLVSEVLPRR